MADEVQIQVVDGDEDDPFTQQTDPLASTDSSTGDDGEGGQDPEDDGQSTDDEDDEDDEDSEYTPDELNTLAGLQKWQEAQAEAAAKAATSQLQSKYDRQIAAQNRQIAAIAAQAETREAELKAAVREAQLNGLTDVQKEQLNKQWDDEDERAKLNAYGQQLSDFHVELLRTAYATEYAEFGLQAEDLEQFDTAEDMEAFIKDVQIEYYKLMADPRVQAAMTTDAPADPAPATAPAAPAARKSPAGSKAPTDAGGGSAPPPTTKFNTNRGVAAMAENIRGGWETPRVS
jgi:hypothetical protein